MSLVSVRNFLTPFSNKVGIGALVVITIIVAVARISGAHSNGSTAPADSAEQTSQRAVDIDELNEMLANQPDFDEPKAALKAGRTAPSHIVEDPVLTGLLADELAVQPKAATKNQQDNKGLSDIKRTLGLE